MCVRFFVEDLHPQPKTFNGYRLRYLTLNLINFIKISIIQIFDDWNFNESAISNEKVGNVDITLCTRWTIARAGIMDSWEHVSFSLISL